MDEAARVAMARLASSLASAGATVRKAADGIDLLTESGWAECSPAMRDGTLDGIRISLRSGNAMAFLGELSIGSAQMAERILACTDAIAEAPFTEMRAPNEDMLFAQSVAQDLRDAGCSVIHVQTHGFVLSISTPEATVRMLKHDDGMVFVSVLGMSEHDHPANGRMDPDDVSRFAMEAIDDIIDRRRCYAVKEERIQSMNFNSFPQPDASKEAILLGSVDGIAIVVLGSGEFRDVHAFDERAARSRGVSRLHLTQIDLPEGPSSGWQVGYSVLERPYRGKGIGKAIYLGIIEKLGPAITDEAQTPSSARLWLSLSATPGIEVLCAYTNQGTGDRAFAPIKAGPDGYPVGVTEGGTVKYGSMHYMVARKKRSSG
jgi:GNAT superfamily N-acetyltransferase